MRTILQRGLWVSAAVLALAGGIVYWRFHPVDGWAAIDHATPRAALAIQHPYPGAVFPANLPAPIVLWDTNAPDVGRWGVGFKAGARRWLYRDVQPPWHPPASDWRQLKAAAGIEPVELIVAGYGRQDPDRVAAAGTVRFTIAKDGVETPLFYREVILPFQDAVKDPSRLRWRFGGIDGEDAPPVVLENLPVCGNCHSFSRNGEYLAMDVDYANSKASYVITRTAREMRLSTSDIITWDDFRKEEGRPTFGLLSQISPDGRYVLSTVKDRSVFVPRPDLAFSQLFFPLKGILAVYDRERKEYAALPGADDPAFVQSNPTWSPDGQWVVFARNRAYELRDAKTQGKILLSSAECEEFLKEGKEFRYDLYRVPFNGGKGGKAEPLRGASGNGRSNYFPKFSPDGRWIVFCQANNYMLLQPDSELIIIPAEGGEARRLGCNLGRMNSWHSWSPDGKWMVFSSKAHSLYTQLYLTRISDQGEASPPVWLDRLVSPQRAANIPEFVSLPKDGIVKINEQFLDDYSFTRAGNGFYRAGEVDKAIENYRKALDLNPNNAMAHQRLGFLLFQVKKQLPEGLEHTRAAVRLEPANGFAHYDLGMDLMSQGDVSNAAPQLAAAAALLPNGYDSQYNAVDINHNWGQALYRLGDFSQCRKAMEAVLRFAPNHPDANFMMAMAMAAEGYTAQTRPYYEKAVAAKPQLARLPDYFDLLSLNYLRNGVHEEAMTAADKAQALAREAGRTGLADQLRRRAEECRAKLQHPNPSNTPP